MHSIQAATQGELSFPAGASMFVGQRLDQHWWAGTHTLYSAPKLSSPLCPEDSRAKFVYSLPPFPLFLRLPVSFLLTCSHLPLLLPSIGTFNGAHGRIPATFIKINAAGAARAPQPSRPAAGYGGGGGGHPWDWGNIPRALAERELMGCNEGTFLVCVMTPVPSPHIFRVPRLATDMGPVLQPPIPPHDGGSVHPHQRRSYLGGW